MRTALLIVDVQNDYFPGGRNELSGPAGAGANVGRLLEAFRAKNLPVVHIQHVSTRPGATFFLPGTKGAEINEIARPLAGEPVIVKHYPSSFRETELLTTLRKADVSRLVICGMMTHMCVDSTVRAAFDLGFECVVAGDACATKSLTFDNVTVPADKIHHAFLAALHGTFALVTTTEQAIPKI